MIQLPGFLHRVSSNLLFVLMMVCAAAYFDLHATGESPTWQNVAVGSMALVGTLAGLGYREFMKKQEKAAAQITEIRDELEKEWKDISIELKEDRKKRDQQHKANVAAIVALSMSVMDKMPTEQRERIQEIIKRLLDDDTEIA